MMSLAKLGLRFLLFQSYMIDFNSKYNRIMSISLFTPFHTRNPLANKNSNSNSAVKSALTSQKRSSASYIKTINDNLSINESEECTFEPRVNDNKKSKRSLEKFLDDQFRYEKNRQQKISIMKQEKEKNQESEITLTPNIDRSSRKMVDFIRQGSSQSIFKRLSRDRSTEHKNEVVCSFSPQILNRSQSIKRKSDVSSLLYNDAKRRQEKSQFIIETDRHYTERPKINSNTNKLVCNKILAQLYNLIKEDEVNPLVAILTLQDIFNVDLNPNKHENSEIVNKIMSFIAQTNEFHVQIVRTRKLHEFISIIINSEEECHYFTKKQQGDIYQSFKHFYKERITKEKKALTPEKISFKPQTLSNSNKLAQAHRNKTCQELGEFLENQKVNLNFKDGEITIEDLFILNHQKKQQQNQRKKMENEMQEFSQCTFKPNVRSSIDSLNKSRQEKKPKITIKTLKKKKQSKQVGSKSDLKENQPPKTVGKFLPPRSDKKVQRGNAPSSQNITKDMEKIVLRMSAGRQKRQFSNKINERGYPKDQNWTQLQRNMHRASVQNLDKIRKLSFKDK